MNFTIFELEDFRVFCYGKLQLGKSHLLPSLSGSDVMAKISVVRGGEVKWSDFVILESGEKQRPSAGQESVSIPARERPTELGSSLPLVLSAFTHSRFQQGLSANPLGASCLTSARFTP